MIQAIRYYTNRFFKRLKRITKYLPVIWSSYDFDYRYATELFMMKLEDIADYMESDRAWSVGSKHNASRIRMVLRLMDKVYNEEYATYYQTQLRDLYGPTVLDVHFTEITTGKGKGGSLITWEYETWDNAEEVQVVQQNLSNTCYLKQKRAHKLLWELIEHNIQHWWD